LQINDLIFCEPTEELLLSFRCVTHFNVQIFIEQFKSLKFNVGTRNSLNVKPCDVKLKRNAGTTGNK